MRENALISEANASTASLTWRRGSAESGRLTISRTQCSVRLRDQASSRIRPSHRVDPGAYRTTSFHGYVRAGDLLQARVSGEPGTHMSVDADAHRSTPLTGHRVNRAPRREPIRRAARFGGWRAMVQGSRSGSSRLRGHSSAAARFHDRRRDHEPPDDRPVKTFSIGFGAIAHDETASAAAAHGSRPPHGVFVCRPPRWIFIDT